MAHAGRTRNEINAKETEISPLLAVLSLLYTVFLIISAISFIGVVQRLQPFSSKSYFVAYIPPGIKFNLYSRTFKTSTRFKISNLIAKPYFPEENTVIFSLLTSEPYLPGENTVIFSLLTSEPYLLGENTVTSALLFSGPYLPGENTVNILSSDL